MAHFDDPPAANESLGFSCCGITYGEYTGFKCGCNVLGWRCGLNEKLYTGGSKESRFHRFLRSILNVLITPFLLLWHSIKVFFVPCMGTFFERCWDWILTLSCFKGRYMFTDPDFPPSSASLGFSNGASVQWERLQNLKVEVKKGKNVVEVQCNVLFDNIEPSDAKQGNLGDCYLLASFAALSERPHLIQNIFVTRQFNSRGRYTLRLFDDKTKAFVNVTIDDYVPVRNGKPIFAQLHTNEMWPILLEKAYAKLKGSYGNIGGGGSPFRAMQNLTGFEVEVIRTPLDEAAFKKVLRCFRAGALLAAGSDGKDRTLEEGRSSVTGTIVGGHAYSILGIYEPMLTTERVRILKLRNPWGTFEWKGDWSDESPLWSTHPGVALEVGRPEKKDDGIFFIPWDAFTKLFVSVFIVYPAYGVEHLHMTVDETNSYCGTCTGCVCGLAKFWCLCGGCYALWFAKDSKDCKEDVQRQEGRCFCC